MRILSCKLENFSSYGTLEFNFTNQGLTLIQGPTGAGKSTLMDAIPWALFGLTAKGGSVSEVLRWPGDKVTTATLTLDDGTVVIRSRGAKAKDNDLRWLTGEKLLVHRGKDLPDTQRQLNQFLGMNYETYLAGAYYHEFSQTAQFFSTTAKNRREITEQLVDLSLATDLQTKSQAVKKAKDKDLTALQRTLDKVMMEGVSTNNALQQALNRSSRWEREFATRASDLQTKSIRFEAARQIDLNEARRDIQVQKELIQTIPRLGAHPKCETCGQTVENDAVHAAKHQENINTKAAQRIEFLGHKIKDIKMRVNPYDVATESTNPHTSEIAEIQDLSVQLDAKEGGTKIEIDQLTEEIADIELLQDVIADYRSTTITNAVQGLEDGTNKLLSGHFDAELRVSLSAQAADKLDVTLSKDGNECSYTQLSKGQRCLLKLAFGVSVMRAVSNYSGIDFRQLFFDEALTGCDEYLKEKAFKLMETLAISRESVFVIEHSENFKGLFTNKYTVSLENGKSVIVHE